MGHHQHPAISRKLGRQYFLPPLPYPYQRVGQRFRPGEIIDGRVTRFVGWMPRVIGGQCGRPYSVAPPPFQYLRVAVAGRRFFLIQTLQGAVMALVQSPVSLYRQVHLLQFFEDQPQCAYRTLQIRGHRQIEDKTLVSQRTAGSAGLTDAAL